MERGIWDSMKFVQWEIFSNKFLIKKRKVSDGIFVGLSSTSRQPARLASINLSEVFLINCLNFPLQV